METPKPADLSGPLQKATTGSAVGAAGFLVAYLYAQSQVHAHSGWTTLNRGDLHLLLLAAVGMAVAAIIFTFLDGLMRWLLVWRAMDKPNGVEIIKVLTGKDGVAVNPLGVYYTVAPGSLGEVVAGGQPHQEPQPDEHKGGEK